MLRSFLRPAAAAAAARQQIRCPLLNLAHQNGAKIPQISQTSRASSHFTFSPEETQVAPGKII